MDWQWWNEAQMILRGSGIYHVPVLCSSSSAVTVVCSLHHGPMCKAWFAFQRQVAASLITDMLNSNTSSHVIMARKWLRLLSFAPEMATHHWGLMISWDMHCITCKAWVLKDKSLSHVVVDGLHINQQTSQHQQLQNVNCTENSEEYIKEASYQTVYVAVQTSLYKHIMKRSWCARS